MERRKIFLPIAFFCVALLMSLSCNLITGPRGDQPEASATETGTAPDLLSTSLTQPQLTLKARPTETSTPAPTLLPTETSEPAQTVQPSLTSTATVGTPLPLVLEIQTSVDTFYCYNIPFELTITVKVSDIERGLAVYYYIQDKQSGDTSEKQKLDLHRQTSDTRDATIIGGGSDEQNLQFPPLMGESYFIYQIVSDDEDYRSKFFSNVTFFPCAQ